MVVESAGNDPVPVEGTVAHEAPNDRPAASANSGFRLTNVVIRNFRGIRELDVDLNETTVLIGENNTGKTAFLEAIRFCLDRLRGRGRGPFAEYDYHLVDADSSPTTADGIRIELAFVEDESAPWSEEITQALADIVAYDERDLAHVTFRVQSSFDPRGSDFATDWDFLDNDGNPFSGRARTAIQLANLQRMAPVFYLSALRDASRHFVSSGRFWRAFLAEIGVPDTERTVLEQQLSDLNRRLIDSHQPLRDVRESLKKATRVIDFGTEDAVEIDALPTKLFSLLTRAQVSLASRSGARIPVNLQGEGTQSLAVLLLFGAFLRSRLSDLDLHATSITALEEPEAHLHPSAIRSLMRLVRELPGQKLISSHSGELLATVPATAIRRFANTKDGVTVKQIDPNTMTDDELRKFDFHVRRTRGELLFANCWLLVEGETETTLLAGAAECLGLDIERAGVQCVEFAQTDVGMLAKVANQLGIPWYCVLDDDSGRRKYESRLRPQFESADESDRLVYPYESIELLLCTAGFGQLYHDRMSSQKRAPSSEKGTIQYWREVLAALPNRYSKPEVATAAVGRMAKGETPVPVVLADILRKAMDLANA